MKLPSLQLGCFPGAALPKPFNFLAKLGNKARQELAIEQGRLDPRQNAALRRARLAGSARPRSSTPTLSPAVTSPRVLGEDQSHHRCL
jgi:hypothetical protein